MLIQKGDQAVRAVRNLDTGPRLGSKVALPCEPHREERASATKKLHSESRAERREGAYELYTR